MRHFVAAGLLGGLLLIPAAARAFEADPAKGQGLATGVCAACHGPDGNSLIPSNPSLAGQHPEYLYKQLRDYKSGARKNPIMAGMAAGLSGGSVHETSDRGEAVAGAHVIYAKEWSSTRHYGDRVRQILESQELQIGVTVLVCVAFAIVIATALVLRRRTRPLLA